ncbi:MAG: hypothetical protein FJX42_06415 [Alphaproteobacteria bacterium]|nr:hypothetical protein [Alphaproteobacteria bacterium]
MSGKGKLVSYEQMLLARLLKQQKETIAGCANIAAAGSRAIKQLEKARDALRNVNDECVRAGERFEESRRFRAACEAAAEMDSLEDMIRRRDELAAVHNRRRAIHTAKK